MGRYLRSVTMKSPDGQVLLPPMCCNHCSEDTCKIPCKKYADAMKDVKCASLCMEWGIYSHKYVFHYILVYILIIGAGAFAWKFIWERNENRTLISSHEDLRLHQKSLIVASSGDTNLIDRVSDNYLKLKKCQ